MRNWMRRKSRNREQGLTMLEVLIAGLVMVVGFMAVMGLVMTAIAANNRNKTDSTSAMLVQALLENVTATLQSSNGVSTITDGNGNTWNISTSTGGATTTGGQIDFSVAAPPIATAHSMNFVVCNGSFQPNVACTGTQTTYDVRWNIRTIGLNNYQITIGAQMLNSGNQARFFALPISLRTYVPN